MRYGPPTCLIVAALILAGCASSGRTPNGTFNNDDVMFLQMMIPHHGQGVRIARLAEKRAVRPDVTTLAAAIDTTQVSEIKTMAGWLRGWHRPPTAPAHSHASHGGMPMTREDEIGKLGAKTGPGFERGFLDMMIAHQDDALQLARREVSVGADPQVRALAERVIRSRTAEIDQMLRLLNPKTNPKTDPKPRSTQPPGHVADEGQAGQ
jgi:uncharacterized protein (DUF305 family)